MLNPVDILGSALIDTGATIISFLPNVIIAVIIFVLGWVFGSVLARAVKHIVSVLGVDKALAKAGLSAISEKAGIEVSVAGFLATIIKWLVIISFTIASAEILGLSQVTVLLRDTLVYIPQVLIAAIVLIIAALVADFVSRIVEHSVKATGIRAHFAASVARWSILIVAGVFPALTQLRIAQGLVEVLFTGLVFSISLALGLSFGLGGKEAASRVIENINKN